jgi:hypothetical protein
LHGNGDQDGKRYGAEIRPRAVEHARRDPENSGTPANDGAIVVRNAVAYLRSAALQRGVKDHVPARNDALDERTYLRIMRVVSGFSDVRVRTNCFRRNVTIRLDVLEPYTKDVRPARGNVVERDRCRADVTEIDSYDARGSRIVTSDGRQNGLRLPQEGRIANRCARNEIFRDDSLAVRRSRTLLELPEIYSRIRFCDVRLQRRHRGLYGGRRSAIYSRYRTSRQS